MTTPKNHNEIEREMIRRLHSVARHQRYDHDEANDLSKAASSAASIYLAETAPMADCLIITSVPFKCADNRFTGAAVSQDVRATEMFDVAMRQDILPMLARFFTSHGFAGFKQRLSMCWKIMFGHNPANAGPETSQSVRERMSRS